MPYTGHEAIKKKNCHNIFNLFSFLCSSNISTLFWLHSDQMVPIIKWILLYKTDSHLKWHRANFCLSLKKKINYYSIFWTYKFVLTKWVYSKFIFFSVEYVTSLLWKLAYVHRNVSKKYYAVVMFFSLQQGWNSLGIKYLYNVIIKFVCK